MKKTTWLAACMAAVCALALVTGCSSETDEPDGIEYDAGKWLIEGRTVLRYTGTETDVQVPDGVTVIGKHAFESRTAVAHVKLPESVAMIGWYAFHGCESLTEVTIPDGVNTIGQNAFQNCKSLADVQIPGGVTEIGQYAFNSCSKLTTVAIPVSVESIGYDAFYCYNLANVTYGGTQEQWDEIEKGWEIFYYNIKTITGKDGSFTVDRNGNIIESE